MRTQLCLLSGELMPNIIGVLFERPGAVVPVVTREALGQLDHFRRALRAAGFLPTLHPPVVVLPYDLTDCLQSMGRVCAQTTNLTVNWTGGTKIMSFAARLAAETAPKTIRALYVNTAGRELLIEETPGRRAPRVELLDTAHLGLNSLVHILAAGHTAPGMDSLAQFRAVHTPPPELEAAAEAIVDARRWEWPDLFELAKAVNKPYRPQKLPSRLLQILETAKLIERAMEPGAFFLGHESLVTPFYRGTEQEENARFLRGSYLEVFLWSQLKHRGAFDDVAWHVVLNAGQPGRMTELDVTVAADGRFLVIECKGRADLLELPDLIEEQYARSRRVGRLFGHWILYIHQFRADYQSPDAPAIIASQGARARDYGGRLFWHDDLADFPVQVAAFLSEIRSHL